MTKTAMVYGNALYDLARDEGLAQSILDELTGLSAAFQDTPKYLRLLSSHALPKEERCGLLDQAFRGKVQPYVLNFLKILTEKGYINQFDGCVQQFRSRYNEDNGILPVSCTSAVAISPALQEKLIKKLAAITGKRIELRCTVDPHCLGGLRLNYGGIQLDGTVRHRLDQLKTTLSQTVL